MGTSRRPSPRFGTKKARPSCQLQPRTSKIYSPRCHLGSRFPVPLSDANTSLATDVCLTSQPHSRTLGIQPIGAPSAAHSTVRISSRLSPSRARSSRVSAYFPASSVCSVFNYCCLGYTAAFAPVKFACPISLKNTVGFVCANVSPSEAFQGLPRTHGHRTGSVRHVDTLRFG